MVLNNTIILEVFASVFTVSSYFTDNPRTFNILTQDSSFVLSANSTHLRMTFANV